MTIQKVPFVNYKIDDTSKKDNARIMSCRLNDKDIEVLEDLKELFDVQADGTMLKIALHNYHHVIHGQFSGEFIRYLFKKQRDRQSDHKDVGKKDTTQKVIPTNAEIGGFS